MKEMKESSKESKERKDRKKATAAVVSAGASAYAYEDDTDVQAFINLFNGEMVEHRASRPTIYRLTPVRLIFDAIGPPLFIGRYRTVRVRNV